MITTRRLLLAVLCLAWALPGLLAHDPWKPDEAYTFGVVYEFLVHGDWLVPRIAGEVFLAEPPFYYLTAALSAQLFSGVLPLHDGARLVTGAYMLLVLLFTALASNELHGKQHGAVAALLLIGCLGLIVRGHQIITDASALAGFAMAYYGFALSRRSAWGGAWTGTGIGLVFVSQGLLETGILIVLAALLASLRDWRSRHYLSASGVALLAALPWLLIWPLLLHAQDPALFNLWLHVDVTERIFGGVVYPLYYLMIIPWYAWPLWALALWALYRARTPTSGIAPGILLPLIGFIVTLVGLSLASDKRELYAMPLLIPLALLATPAALTLRRGAANAWYWFSLMAFTFFVIVAWFYWTALEIGLPARLHAHLHRLQPGYDFGFHWLPFLLGVLYTLAWFAVAIFYPRRPERPAAVWATGLTVVWGLVAILFIGWVDTGKSYRSMVASLQKAMPASYQCVASRDLGEAQRAMLHYFAGIVTEREERLDARRDCDLLLVQGVPGIQPRLSGWERIWEGARPGDKAERYRLYRRTTPRAPR